MKNPKVKIASLLPSATEIICCLGLEQNLIGITHECDFPITVAGKTILTASRISHKTMSSSEIDHAVRSQIDGHGSIYDLNEKLLHELNPDLIITQELCDVCAVSYKTVQKAAKMYVANAKVVSLEPNSIEDIFSNIKTIGKLCYVAEKADQVVRDLRNRLKKVRTELSQIEKRPRVFMLEWLEPPFAPGHWVPEQVEAAGGECLLGIRGEKSVVTTFDRIIESNPEILVVIPCGYYIKDIRRQIGYTRFPERLKEIRAVKTGNIWAVDATSYFSRPGPRVVVGAEILSRIVAPGLFGEPGPHEAQRIPVESLVFQKAGTA